MHYMRCHPVLNTHPLVVQYDMPPRGIWLLKLILLLFGVDWGPIYPKMSGAKFSDIGAPRTELVSIQGGQNCKPPPTYK